MAERRGTRCRKGDMKIDLESLEVRITTFVDRYLQHLSLTISDDEWPLSWEAFASLAAPLP